jgi:hypothetical protein
MVMLGGVAMADLLLLSAIEGADAPDRTVFSVIARDCEG